MSHKNEDSEQKRVSGDMEQPDDGFIPDDATPVCPKCFKPCHPLQYYCTNCDSSDAINPLTPYIGFVNIRFNYDIFLSMWRRVWHDKDTPAFIRALYFAMIVLLVPIFAVLGLPLLLIGKIPQRQLRRAVLAAFVIIMFALLVWLLYLCYPDAGKVNLVAGR
jgi:hypothetical protein